MERDAGKNRDCGRLPNWLIADRIARISIDRVGDPIGFLVVGSNEPWWCSKWKQDDRVYTGVHGRCSRRSRFHRRWAESRASRVPASPASRCVLALLGIVIGDKFSTAWPADIDFLPAWRHAYKLRPLQLIGAFTFERHVINCRLEEKTRDGNRARLSGPGILYTFPRASSRNQWPEPLMSPKENGNYCLSTVLPPINNEGWFLRFQKFPFSFFFFRRNVWINSYDCLWAIVAALGTLMYIDEMYKTQGQYVDINHTRLIKQRMRYRYPVSINRARQLVICTLCYGKLWRSVDYITFDGWKMIG